MASSGTTTVNATYTTSGNVGDAIRFSWWINSQSVASNTTNVGWKLELLSYGAGYIASSAGKSWSVTVNGSNYSGSNTVGISSNSTKTLASGSTDVGHNNDGTKAFSYSFSQQFSITFNSWVGTVSGNGSDTLTTIPRYADNVSFSSSGTDLISAAFRWSAGQTCSRAIAYVNGAEKYNSGAINTGSGTFSITGLEPNKTYSVKLNLTRKDSGLSKDYQTINVTTQQIATLSGSFHFDIGSDLALTLVNSERNASTVLLSVEDDNGTWTDITTAAYTIAKGTSSHTWTLSASAATLYQKCTTRNQMKIRISCGTMLNGIRYENLYTGVASVKNSNPAFNSYSIANTVDKINTVLGSTLHIPQGYGNMRITIPPADKATAKNYAVIRHYTIQVLLGDSVIKNLNLNYSMSALTSDTESYTTPGTYTVKICAVDSRGNTSPYISRTFYVLPYHLPVPYITLYRHNSFEDKILISSYYLYSKLQINSVDKNNSFSVQYRCREVGSSIWSTWSTLKLGDAAAADANESKKTFEETSSSNPWLSKPNINSYTFEFKLTDSIHSVVSTVSLPQGIAILLETDNGYVTVGKMPAWESSAKLQVQSDIMVHDTDGSDRLLLDTIKNIIICSNTEPKNQIAGGIWCKTS